MADYKKRKSDQLIEEVKKIRKHKSNLSCADCGVRSTPYVSTTFGTFICTPCSGIHRKYSYRVQSIAVGTFKPKDIEKLKETGNEISNKHYLAKYKSGSENITFPIDPTDRETVENLITQKYVNKTWYKENIKDKKKKIKKKHKKKPKKESSTDDDDDNDESSQTEIEEPKPKIKRKPKTKIAPQNTSVKAEEPKEVKKPSSPANLLGDFFDNSVSVDNKGSTNNKTSDGTFDLFDDNWGDFDKTEENKNVTTNDNMGWDGSLLDDKTKDVVKENTDKKNDDFFTSLVLPENDKKQNVPVQQTQSMGQPMYYGAQGGVMYQQQPAQQMYYQQPMYMNQVPNNMMYYQQQYPQQGYVQPNYQQNYQQPQMYMNNMMPQQNNNQNANDDDNPFRNL